VIEDLEQVLAPQKLLGVRVIVSPLGALKIWRNPTPQLKPPNSVAP